MSTGKTSIRRILLMLAVVGVLAGAAAGVYFAVTARDGRARVMGAISVLVCGWLVLVLWDMVCGREEDLFEQHYGTGGRTRLSRRKRPNPLQMKYYSWNEPGKKGCKDRD